MQGAFQEVIYAEIYFNFSRSFQELASITRALDVASENYVMKKKHMPSSTPLAVKNEPLAKLPFRA
jgi:hypothetical protein